jgi:hypothetical protein
MRLLGKDREPPLGLGRFSCVVRLDQRRTPPGGLGQHLLAASQWVAPDTWEYVLMYGNHALRARRCPRRAADADRSPRLVPLLPDHLEGNEPGDEEQAQQNQNKQDYHRTVTRSPCSA